MRLVYIDEAGLSSRKQEPYLIIGAVVVDADKKLAAVENHLDKIVKRFIPQEHWKDFVFHATHLFNWGGKVFTKNNPDWPLHKRLEIADALAAIPKKFGLPLIATILERATFPKDPEMAARWTPRQHMIGAHVTSFMVCAAQINAWMKQNTTNENCLLVVENNDQARTLMTEFQNEAQDPSIVDRLPEATKKLYPLRRIKQNPLFEPKKKSSVLQLADFWAYVLKRSAMNDERYYRFFDAMKPMYWQFKA